MSQTEPYAATDSYTLERILTNRRDNAYCTVPLPCSACPRRAGRPRRVTITAAAKPGWTVVEVRDAGPGIPPHLMAHATRRFSRSPKRDEGAGLGLSMSNR